MLHCGSVQNVVYVLQLHMHACGMHAYAAEGHIVQVFSTGVTRLCSTRCDMPYIPCIMVAPPLAMHGIAPYKIMLGMAPKSKHGCQGPCDTLHNLDMW